MLPHAETRPTPAIIPHLNELAAVTSKVEILFQDLQMS